MSNNEEGERLWMLHSDYRVLETDLIILLRYIDLNEKFYNTNSAEIRKLILASCSFIERMMDDLISDPYINEQKIPEKLPRESIVSYIYRLAKLSKIELSIIKGRIHNQTFSSWQPQPNKIEPSKCKKEHDTYSFDWWNTYNDIKHNKSLDKDTKPFESAIKSTLAVFSLLVYMTSTDIRPFWYENDQVRIVLGNSERKPFKYNTRGDIHKPILNISKEESNK